MKNFSELINEAENIAKYKDFSYLNKNIQPLFKLLKKQLEKTPNMSEQDVYNYFQKLFKEINANTSNSEHIFPNMVFMDTYKDILDDPEWIKPILDRLIPKYEKITDKNEAFSYISEYNERADCSKSFEEILKCLIEEELIYFTCARLAIPEDKANNKSIMNKQLNELSGGPKRITQIAQKSYLGKDFREQFINYLKYELKEKNKRLENKIKKVYIDSIILQGEIIKKIDVIESYSKQQESFIKKLSCNGVKIENDLTYPTYKKDKDSISIDSFFSNKNRKDLEKLTLEQLVALNAYWANRISKEILNMNETFFMLMSTGKLSQMLRTAKQTVSEFKPYYDSKIKDVNALKLSILEQILDEILKEGNLKDSEISTIVNGSKYEFGIQACIEKYAPKYEKEYKEYFSKLLPEVEHSLKDDLNIYMQLHVSKKNMYKVKSDRTLALLSELYRGNISQNWGIIPGKNDKYVLIAADIKGINGPIRLHIPRVELDIFYERTGYSKYIPVYEGNNEYKINDEFLTTQLLMPICPKQRKAIKELTEKYDETTEIGKVARHLAYLAELTEYPEHRDWVEVEKNGKKVYEPAQKKYFSLETNKTVSDLVVKMGR